MKTITRQITCIFLCAMLTLLITPKLDAQDAPSEVIQVAEEELPVFLSHLSELTPSQLEDYGFSEDDNLDDAVLGHPYLQYLIYQKEVINYLEGDSIYDVLTGSSEWYFPIMIGDEARCLLLVAKVDNEWDMAASGYAGIAKQLGLLRKVWPVSQGYDPLFIKCWVAGAYYFSVPQVDLYNLTKLHYSETESEEEVILLYQDLRPLSETMEDIASYIDFDYDDYSGVGFDTEHSNRDSDGGCFISTTKGDI